MVCSLGNHNYVAIHHDIWHRGSMGMHLYRLVDFALTMNCDRKYQYKIGTIAGPLFVNIPFKLFLNIRDYNVFHRREGNYYTLLAQFEFSYVQVFLV